LNSTSSPPTTDAPLYTTVIDLHVHSDESDGSWRPARLVEEAVALGMEALAITDHDTFNGFELAREPARAAGLDLVCGIEIGTRLKRENQPVIRDVHVLGYFLDQPPPARIHQWLDALQLSRNDRNTRLAAKLQSLGLKVKLEEAQAHGRTLTGRPHFAKVLVEKGYAASIPDAFKQYLDESAQAYVPRRNPPFAEAVAMITASGGLPVLAHPYKLAGSSPRRLESLITDLVALGLRGIEAYHSEHSPAGISLYLALARAHGLVVTGGSDFHGEAKPGVELGRGKDGRLCVPRDVLQQLRDSVRH
jgi:3',5'-nucleoside bisphosphate phosphatase